MVTLGNWTWGQHGFAPYLSGTDRVLRPANMSPRTPGRGLAVHDGVAVINLLGPFSLDPFESPFLAADRLVEEARRATPVIVVDFHAEATSEKVALARYLDGRVTAVIGTHTHVQTNDARVLAGGTAAITDAGMTGPHDSVIGSERRGRDPALRHRHARAARAGDAATCASRARSSSAAATAARAASVGRGQLRVDVAGRLRSTTSSATSSEVAREHDPARSKPST